MRNGLTGQSALSAVARTGFIGLALLLTGALAACTTVEGTNALTDVGTFEREVMTSTAQGLGLVPKGPPKAEPTQARAPLALPRDNNALPAPSTSMANQLPVDSDSVQIDTTNLTEADMVRLRNARVVDLRSLSGRPLTEAETKALTARMTAANMAVTTNGKRPLYLPPDEYFTRVGDADLVCAIGNGEIVSLKDPRCPEAVRKALSLKGPDANGSVSGAISSDINAMQNNNR